MNHFTTDCKECRENFPSVRSLHSHLKKHNLSVGSYYLRHWDKKDLLTGEEIRFVHLEQYRLTDFVNSRNLKDWLKRQPKEESGRYIKEVISAKLEEKQIKFGPPDLYFKLSKLPQVEQIRAAFGSCKTFWEELHKEIVYSRHLPDKFWHETPAFPILIDTREQKPYQFNKGTECKLDFGDYTAAGELYSRTFIDRKSESDFKGTFTAGFDRVIKEIDRARSNSAFLFFLIESTPESVEYNNQKDKYGRVNIDFLWHNVKEVMAKYPDTVQFVFGGNRIFAQDLARRLLFFGRELWDVDVNFFVERRINGF